MGSIGSLHWDVTDNQASKKSPIDVDPVDPSGLLNDNHWPFFICRPLMALIAPPPVLSLVMEFEA